MKPSMSWLILGAVFGLAICEARNARQISSKIDKLPAITITTNIQSSATIENASELHAWWVRCPHCGWIEVDSISERPKP